MTPAEEITAAVEKLHNACMAAAPGPWKIAKVPPYTDPLIMSRYEETLNDEEVLIVGNIDVAPEDQAAIETLHPGVGLALAAWLDEEASLHADDGAANSGDGSAVNCENFPHALAVARAINVTGSQS
ncbi:hypothetical protein ACIRF8_15260 [Streptomyces sp. NPDC102406]|uniref:hypothetical protein n=1 Tax=Streptomyces sp. NPDC102406 TaxID=3366171 RepID=UPI0038114CAB